MEDALIRIRSDISANGDLRMKRTANIALFSVVSGLVAGLAPSTAAWAQEAIVSGQFERPYGMSYGQETSPYEPGTRDLNGNRVIVDGRIIDSRDSSSLSFGMNTPWGTTRGTGMIGQSQAIGNQLNVITNGNYNTIIIDNTQINNGDQTAILNGELDLND